MKSSCTAFLGMALLLPTAQALADTGEAVVKARCSLCHEGGAGGAPKIGNREDWEPRAARGKIALYEIALKGKPKTAMMARGGFRDLSTDEVMAAVDYMVARAGLNPVLRPEAPRAAENPAAMLPETPLPVVPAAVFDWD